MASLRHVKIKTGSCKRVLKELLSYEKEVKQEAEKTADMKEKGADLYDLKQQEDTFAARFALTLRAEENVLAESRMMIPDCRKRLEVSLADLKAALKEVKESSQDGPDISEAESIVLEVECCFRQNKSSNLLA
ncbi:Tubulin-specific chaperone A [Platanthera zijinensis]|uniref:Tubulin-specific chaperone A n=1 Tax=Platanthera zijinensis TaxID=2320716 RepID=A0AAP0GF34_9ASPA